MASDVKYIKPPNKVHKKDKRILNNDRTDEMADLEPTQSTSTSCPKQERLVIRKIARAIAPAFHSRNPRPSFRSSRLSAKYTISNYLHYV